MPVLRLLPMVRLLIVWPPLFGLYLLFAGTISRSELITGAAVASLATGFALLLHGAETRRFDLRAPWRRVLGRPLAAVVPDAIKVGAVLLAAMLRRPAGPLGRITRQPFRPGGSEPAEAARRGLVMLAASFAPNRFALCIPDGKDTLLLHRLASDRAKPDPEWPL